MTVLTISTRLLAAIAKWSIADDGRPHLQVVSFAGRRAVACDGHRLVIVPLEQSVNDGFTLHRDDIAAAAAAQRELPKYQHERQLRISVDGNRATIGLDKDGVRTMVVKADKSDRYPDIDQVIPKKAEGDAPGAYVFNPVYMAAIHEVVEAANWSSQRGVRIKAWSADTGDGLIGPMLFEDATGIQFVLMPMRVP